MTSARETTRTSAQRVVVVSRRSASVPDGPDPDREGAQPPVHLELVGAGVQPACTPAPSPAASPRTLPLEGARAEALADRLWLAVASWYQADRQPPAIGVDAGLVTVVAVAVCGASSRGPLVALVVTVLGGLTFGLHKNRSCIEAQGIGWAARPVAWVAATAATLAGLLDGGHTALRVAVVELVTLLGSRAVMWFTLGFARRRGHGLCPTVVVGHRVQLDHIAGRLETFPEAGLRLAGRVDPTDEPTTDAVFETIDRLLERFRSLQVLVAADNGAPAVLRDLARYGGPRVDCAVVPPVGALFGPHLPNHIGDLGVVAVFGRRSRGTDAVKRIVDIALSSILIVFLSPILAAAALATRLHDRGPALFRQPRVGRDGRLFDVLKFRSMVVDAEALRRDLLDHNISDGLLFKLHDDPRVTPVGRLLRRSSIDELPQLFNVLRGEMSLVGPRPLPVAPEEFDQVAAVRHAVDPGMTGPWQVHGSNALPYADMLDLDLTYVVGHSLGMDLKLMLKTLPALFVRRGAY
jgi:lipopolysaccharide/colanic/teichoic acid biosynthesis glycosyltransferase